MTETNRREFLKDTGRLAATTAAITLASGAVARQANAPLPVAVIGTGGMGSNHVRLLSSRPDVRVAYVCDVDEGRLARAAREVETRSKKAPKAVKDLRRVLDDKDVVAVWIATPDHWHGPATILACDAGKHVYVEKPCAHNVREGRLMIEAARRNKRVVQVGTQSRSTEHVRKAMDLLREGVIGDILVSKAWNSQKRKNIGHAKPSQPPAGLDYDQWVGPAPLVPYQSDRLHYTWHWWFDFGTGDMGNDGVHDIDIARWGLGVETHPSSVAALGGKFFFDDDQQFPDTQYVVFEYPGNGKVGQKRQLIYEHRIWSPYHQEGFENGNAFYGTKGMMILGKGGGWRVTLAGNKPGPSMKGSPSLPAHHGNFLECIHSGKSPNADIEINHLSAVLCHLGNIATRLGRTVIFDPKKEEITGDAEGAKLVRRNYREGHWAVPKGV
jgi:predicted dehydrogenase